jgi:hypothetical protein
MYKAAGVEGTVGIAANSWWMSEGQNKNKLDQ